MNKLGLTTAKSKAKIDSYTSWNKAFRVLIEIVTLNELPWSNMPLSSAKTLVPSVI